MRARLMLAKRTKSCFTLIFKKCSSRQDKSGRYLYRRALLAILLILFVGSIGAPNLALGYITPEPTAPPKANLDQAKNGTAASPTSPVDWVNGNLGSSNTHYREGHSVPYRMVFTDVATGSHYVTIEWDIKHSGANAIDYITHFNRLLPHTYAGHAAIPAIETIDPLLGLGIGSPTPTTFPIPPPSSAGSSVPLPLPGQPRISFDALPAGEKLMTIYNGTITGITYLSQGNLLAATASTRCSISFIADSPTVVLAWGGHIGSAADWGSGNSAGGISGSPYHTRLIEFDGGGGNQDRSLSAQAVVLPPTCSISGLISVCSGTSNTYTAITNGCSPTFSWSFTSNTSGASFCSGTTSSTVCVSSGTGGSYTLRVDITACDGGATFCDTTVTVNALPGCSVNGPDSVCPGSTNNHCAPAGLGSYSWTISGGGGTIIGSSTGQCVTVQASGTCGTSYTLNLTVTGACASSCSKTVLVKDNIKPTIVCPADIVASNGNCCANVSFAPTVNDNCSATFVCTPPSGFCFPVGMTTVKCVATDVCGNKDSCTFKITVTDTTKPTIVCPANIVKNTDPGLCCAAATFAPTTGDNCPGQTFTCTPPSGTCFPVGVNPVKCVVTDAAGNKDSCSFTVTVTDNSKPTIVCPSNISKSNDPGQCCAAATFAPTTGDNCPGETFSCTPPSGTCFGIGTTPVKCVVTDAAGNKDSCTFTVTVSDTEPPSIVCPADIVASNGGCCDVVNFAPTVSDNCPGETFACVPPSGFCFPVGMTTVTCTATDAAGNQTPCNFKITVTDTSKPTIVCPANIVKNTDPGLCCAVATFAPTTGDNCPGETFVCTPPSGFCFPVGVNPVKCVVTDAAGNKDSCTFTVTVSDNSKPTIVCPANITKGTDPGLCCAVATFAPTTGDNCPGEIFTCTPPSGTCFGIGTTPVKCVVTDASGNKDSCTFTVTVSDNSKPTIVCPANITKGTDPGLCCAVATFAPTVGDNCPNPTFVCTPPSGTCFNKGTNTVKCVVTDASGNKDSCTFTVTVNDNTKPTITCPANITKGTDPGLCCAVATFVPTVGDNCPGQTFTCTPPSGTCFNVGTNTVKCVVTDAAGNKDSCTFTVTVTDNTKPNIACPANITKGTDPGLCCAVATFAPTVGDNCPGQTFTCTPPSGTCFAIGTTTVKCVVTDAAGNKDSCTFTVTVNDNTKPSIVCPANITKGNDPGQCCAVATFAPTVGDNCPGQTFSCTPPSGTCYPLGVNTVKCVATDAAGNKDSCTFTVTVNDTTKPSIACPPDKITPPRQPGVCPGPVVTYEVPATDNCPGPITVNCIPPSGSAFPVGMTTVNCTATDAAGNQSSCSFKVTVPATDPTFFECKDTASSASVNAVVQIPIQITNPNPAFILSICGATRNGSPAVPTNPPAIQNNNTLVWAVNGDTGFWCFCLKLSDGCDSGFCQACIQVNPQQCFRLCIETVHPRVLGGDVNVYINNLVEAFDPDVLPYGGTVGGFSFLLSYDCSCLQFISAAKGSLLVEQRWEFFTYRFGALGNGNCGSGCPTCLIRIVAIADINNSNIHPPPPPRKNKGQWVCLKFRTSSDLRLAGLCCPINWWWFDCSDNTISDWSGNTLWIVDSLYTPEGNPIDLATTFPTVNVEACSTLTGGPGKPTPKPCIIFCNGKICLPPIESLDDRGDINLNGLSNEIADAVLFETYFIFGTSVFTISVPGQTAATDINGDGRPLTIADLVALTRIITGDANPLPKANAGLASVDLNWSSDGKELKFTTSSTSEIGGLFVRFKYSGDASEQNLSALANSMNLKANVAEGELRVLINSDIKGAMIPAGKATFTVPIDGEVEFVEAQASNYFGQSLPVVNKATPIPTAFGLSQNYPNPFNPKTNFVLALPVASHYNVTIYNLLGEAVRTFEGDAAAGNKVITWDATDRNGNAVSSGLYFYKAVAGQFVAKKKMILMR